MILDTELESHKLQTTVCTVFEEKQLVVFAYEFTVPCSVPGRQW